LQGATRAFCYQFEEVLTLLFFLHHESGDFSILMNDIFCYDFATRAKSGSFLAARSWIAKLTEFLHLKQAGCV
jgi:hypothetical protein